MPEASASSAPPWSAEATRAVVASAPHAMLPALQALQSTFGYVHPQAIDVVAEHLNVSQAEVYGVLTFYRDLRSAPCGNHRLSICRAEACQSVGARALWSRAIEHLDARHDGTTADGSLTLTESFCLGNCALGPSVLFDDHVIGRVDSVVLDRLIDRVRATTGVTATPVDITTQVDIATQVDTATQIDMTSTSAESPRPAVTVYVPGDSAARSVGADDVASAISTLAAERGITIDLVRNGTRGALWLEPLVEIDRGNGRIAYGPIDGDDVADLIDAMSEPLRSPVHPKHLGDIEQHEWFAAQERITLCRMGIVDPRSPVDFERHGGLSGLRAALAMTSQAVVDVVKASGLRGRGGAGFPTGIKWQTVLDAPPHRSASPAGNRDSGSPDSRDPDSGDPDTKKYVCANADEGDSGTFADRMLMEGDPFGVIEGIAIAAHAVGAHEAFIYIRSEYPDAVAIMRAAVESATEQGWLGTNILGSGFDLSLHVRVGAGAYICGEETAMLESLEGKRGMVRPKPPLPALEGLYGKPTVVNNVLTLASVPALLAGHAERYASLGIGPSTGTQVFQLAGNIARGGAVEIPFGVRLRDLVVGLGGGTRSGTTIGAVQIGGPLGAYFPTEHFDVAMAYESLAAAGGLLGHGGVVVFDDTVDLGEQARFAMEFCAEESCGKCTPCRIGSTRGVELIDRLRTTESPARHDADLELLDDLCEVMASGSLCAMGGLTPVPVRSIMRHFPDHLTHRSTQR